MTWVVFKTAEGEVSLVFGVIGCAGVLISDWFWGHR